MSEAAELAKALRPDAGHSLRQGIVTAALLPLCSVKWGNAADASPSQRSVRSYTPVEGDVVWGIRDGDDTLVLGPVDAPSSQFVGGAGMPAFQNSWTNYGGGYSNARYWRDAGGYVHLSGLVTGGSAGNTIFTLPVGFRPATHFLFPAVANSAASWGVVEANGNVKIHVYPGGWTSLDGVVVPTF